MRSGRFSFFALAFLFSTGGANAVTLLVQPNKIYLSGQRGLTTEQEIVLATMESRDLAVKLTIESFTLDQSGHPLHRPDPAVSQWASLPMTDAVIRRGEHLSLRLRLTIPADARGTLWCALMIESPSEALPNGTRITSRVAVPIFLTAEGTESPRAVIDGLQAVSKSPDEIVVAVRIRNTGNTVLRAPMTVAIEQNRIELATADEPDFVVLPDGERVVLLRVKGRFADVSHLSATAFYRMGAIVITASSAVTTPGKRV